MKKSDTTVNPIRLLPYAERLKLYEKEKDKLLRKARDLPTEKFQAKLKELFKRYDI